MRVSIISTIAATLLAASSAAPFNTSCRSQTDSLRQHQIDVLPQFVTVHVTFCTAPASEPRLCFSQDFPADGRFYPISKFILFPLFPSQLEKRWEFLTADHFFLQHILYPSE
jgi:hypothetical protein